MRQKIGDNKYRQGRNNYFKNKIDTAKLRFLFFLFSSRK
jgi:hypothetical protein